MQGIRRAASAAIAALAPAACGNGGASGDAPDPSPATTAAPATSGPVRLPEGPSALDSMRSEDFPEPLVDPGEIFPGGPPPDRIPPIDDPAFISVEAAGEWLDDAAAGVGLEVDGDARADPVQVLIRHEIVNDTVGIDLGGRPAVILWKAGRASALDRSGVAAEADVGSVGGFDPTVDGRRLTFTADADGTFSDEQTGTRWDVTGVAISGGPAGDGVDRILHLDTSWFASSTRRPGTTPATPEATVGRVDRSTGSERQRAAGAGRPPIASVAARRRPGRRAVASKE